VKTNARTPDEKCSTIVLAPDVGALKSVESVGAPLTCRTVGAVPNTDQHQ
jgi:hypothetical protein